MKLEYSPESKPDAAAQAITHLTLAVFRLNGVLLHWGDRLVEPLGLTSARWQMLGALALAGTPLTAPQIGEAMGVTRQGAQKQLNLLVRQGLVGSHANPAHRRSPLHALTQQGRDLYRQAESLWYARAGELAAQIPAADARAAGRALDSMLRQLQTATPPLGIES